VRALVAHLAASLGVDDTRVFATGYSNGGQMAIRLALEAPDLVAAVAPVIASLPAATNSVCRSRGEPVSILFMNGTADPINPWRGGEVALFGGLMKRGRVLSGEDSAAWFAALAGHTGPPRREELADRSPDDGSTVERVLWSGPGRKSVALYAVRGGGHTVPHPAARGPRLLGRTNADVTAAAEIEAFFRAETAGRPKARGGRRGAETGGKPS
jgi:polyhydroxybutyrate depolymerase